MMLFPSEWMQTFQTPSYRFGRLFKRGRGFRWLGELTFLDDTELDLSA
jgi:hypothetical protein